MTSQRLDTSSNQVDSHANSSESVNFVIHHRVQRGKESLYESWLSEITKTASTFPGHQGVRILRPIEGHTGYSIVVNFASVADATHWKTSTERADLINKVKEHLETDEHTSFSTGIDFLFTPNQSTNGNPPAKPKPWKQWLITTSVIWPLTMIVPPILSPLFKIIPILNTYGVAHGIRAAAIVSLVVWIIMPRYTKLVHRWLFKP